METNLLYCTRTGRTISEKTMEDGNDGIINNEKNSGAPFSNIYGERLGKLTTNGHDNPGECSSPSDQSLEPRRQNVDIVQDEKCKQRINPLRIHLGKRPFVENSLTYNSASKKRKPYVIKHSETIPKNIAPRVPKLIPKRGDHGQFHNPKLHVDNALESEKDKPVPRLVPKSHLSQFKKGKIDKGPQLKEYAQSLGLQPMVKFKCRKCCSMSFKTLAMLKEHQLICRAQTKEPTLSPEAACTDTKQSSGGPSRVTRKVYLCSACGTYYENWNLFLHMREVHNRHICLYCLGMFSKAEKLSLHLTNKHNVQENNFNTKDEFCSVHNGTFYLMCCACDEICCEKDDYFNHDCNNVKPKPVPVLVSKNSLKPNNIKRVKQDANGHSMKGLQTLCDKKDYVEQKPEAMMPSQNIFNSKNNSETFSCDTSVSSLNSSESLSRTANDSVDSIYDQENHMEKSPVSPKYVVSQNLSNGDDHLEHSEERDSQNTSQEQTHLLKVPKLIVKSPQPPVEKEKEGGIKLKLSLNNANSPVIINSTVDPTVGQQYANKPPSRNRRPPKRYEKEKPPDTTTAIKPPSIKMTICDRADSPFVKTTIYENNKETIVKTLINNNVESTSVKPSDNKSDSTIKTTIYDNKFEDENTLNRVPKLTVRVPKEFLDKDSSSDYSSDSDASEKLTVDDKNITVEHKNEAETEEPISEPILTTTQITNDDSVDQVDSQSQVKEEKQSIDESISTSAEPKSEPLDIDVTGDINVDESEPIDDIPVTDLTLDRPLDRYPLKDLLKVFLSSTMFNCIYCNHGRVIAVNCEQLALHMVAQHRFAATVDSITAEELMPETIIAKLKSGAEELSSVYINLDTYDSIDKYDKMTFNQLFECFQCYFKTPVHKDLYLHNRKMHQKTILLCVMCKNNFYTYSELICHLCPGTYDSDYEIRFRCCFCTVDTISSSFRLMVHLRKIHHTCDVCLEFCQSQARLSNHVWKHKLHHLCYRCGIAYRNKPDINNHLFWKHGTESVLCKKCLQKKWPHVYHFCTPPAVFTCDECTLQFTKAVCLKVHKRFHSKEYPHLCTEEGCTEKFVSKKLLSKHLEEHRKKLFAEDLDVVKPVLLSETTIEGQKEQTPMIDLVNEKPKDEVEGKAEAATEHVSKKSKKKKMKEKDALLLEVDLPALNLSESDSSDESDSGQSQPIKAENTSDSTSQKEVDDITIETKESETRDEKKTNASEAPLVKEEDKTESIEDKPSDQTVLEIWDNFKKYQAKVEKQKTPPLVPIKKHVCDSDHDYCLIPADFNAEDEGVGADKKKNKKSPKKRHGGLSSSSSSSSDSDSSCSCGSNCSCSSSSGSSSSSSSDSDSSDESGNEKKKNKLKKTLPNRRLSNGSNVDVMGMSETPVLAPEKAEPSIAETDLETDESETDEEFYDKNPQQIANKAYNEKRNQLLHSASEGGSASGNVSRNTTPVKEEEIQKKMEPDIPPTNLPAEEIKPEIDIKDKTSSSKKKSKKKKKSKSSRKHGPIKINIPKDIIRTAPKVEEPPSVIPNKITISLQTNTVQMPEPPKPVVTPNMATQAAAAAAAAEKKRSSKRRRVPNKFYGYSSDEEGPHTTMAALKPQQPPKLEWRKEDLPSPVTHKTKKEMPSMTPQRLFNYNEPIRFSAPPAPDPEPPRILMNTESLESSDSDSSEEGALQIHQPSSVQNSIPVPPPTYLNSGTSSLPYAFQRPAVRQAREGESVYCYCRCPYDEVSEMIACDAEGCPIEWFHFECVGIMVPPKGKWYCPECRKNQSFSGYR